MQINIDATRVQLFMFNNLQVHSLHRPSYDAGNRGVSHERHRQVVAAHCPQCPGLHYDQEKPGRDSQNEPG